MIVYVLVIHAGKGGSTEVEVFTGSEKRMQFLANWCRSEWDIQGGHDEDLLNDNSAVDRFFEFWKAEGYKYNLSTKNVNP